MGVGGSGAPGAGPPPRRHLRATPRPSPQLSNYNLLPAAQLATAWYFADPTDAIPECSAPADVGGFVYALPAFKKIVGSARGTYVEIETGEGEGARRAGICLRI